MRENSQKENSPPYNDHHDRHHHSHDHDDDDTISRLSGMVSIQKYARTCMCACNIYREDGRASGEQNVAMEGRKRERRGYNWKRKYI